MDINLLALNLGNSRLAIGVFQAGELLFSDRIEIDRQHDWPAAITTAWKKISPLPGAAVCGASVNPPMEKDLERIVQDTCNRQVQWIGRQIEIPIDVLTETPEQTGIDRVLNIAAAFEQMEKACVVVDAGTAITVNVCNDTGNFLGGAIAPGAKLMLNALHEHTETLPQTTLQAPNEIFGRSTISAMHNGVYHGIRGMVKELVEMYAVELGQWPEIIATGGDAQLLFGGWELIHAIAPDLTLYGIALAYTEHHIRNEAQG